MRRFVGACVAVVLLAAAACGGDDGGGDAVDVELEPIAAIEPCDLLDEGTAAELVGADVRRVDDPDLGDDESGCDYELADDTGTGVAASMRLSRGSTDDIPGGALARSMSLGDGGAVETTDTEVKVVYVVREVVVRIEVAPASGEVSDDIVEAVVDFAIETEAPVVEAVTGEAPPTTEAETTTTTEGTTTTPEASTTTSLDADVETLWGRTATEFREQIGEQFSFACPPGGTPRTVWGDHRTGYTDDSSVCTAAVHAGEITIEEGGTVLIQMVPGQDSYPGSEANGIVSQEWPTPWPAGYLVLEGE